MKKILQKKIRFFKEWSISLSYFTQIYLIFLGVARILKSFISTSSDSCSHICRCFQIFSLCAFAQKYSLFREGARLHSGVAPYRTFLTLYQQLYHGQLQIHTGRAEKACCHYVGQRSNTSRHSECNGNQSTHCATCAKALVIIGAGHQTSSRGSLQRKDADVADLCH